MDWSHSSSLVSAMLLWTPPTGVVEESLELPELLPGAVHEG